jgi:hypothetical protein
MTRPSTPLYSTSHDKADLRIARQIAAGCEQAADRPLVFFRADDIGIPSRRFSQLIECFRKHRLPLCLATVPAWLTEKRLAGLRRVTGTGNGQWCWHQHGHVHRNFEAAGKKQEFGPSRDAAKVRESLQRGRVRLAQLLGEDFLPVFTPPWNRCSAVTLQTLTELGYLAVSRSKGARPEPLENLTDFQVNVDLHTRKEQLPEQAFANLLKEIEEGLASGRCGIMIHHQRMNGRALRLLDILLEQIGNNQTIVPVHFGDLLKEKS